jgi:hypothetical protein
LVRVALTLADKPDKTVLILCLGESRPLEAARGHGKPRQIGPPYQDLVADLGVVLPPLMALQAMVFRLPAQEFPDKATLREIQPRQVIL